MGDDPIERRLRVALFQEFKILRRVLHPAFAEEQVRAQSSLIRLNGAKEQDTTVWARELARRAPRPKSKSAKEETPEESLERLGRALTEIDQS